MPRRASRTVLSRIDSSFGPGIIGASVAETLYLTFENKNSILSEYVPQCSSEQSEAPDQPTLRRHSNSLEQLPSSARPLPMGRCTRLGFLL